MIYYKSHKLIYYTLNEKYESRLSDILNSKLIHIYDNSISPNTTQIIFKITNSTELEFIYRIFYKWHTREIQDLKESL